MQEASFVISAWISLSWAAHRRRNKDYPAVYVRRDGKVTEHLLEPHPLLNFEGVEHQKALSAALDRLLSPSLLI